MAKKIQLSAAEIEKITQKILNGEDVSGEDEETLKLLQALVEESKKHHLAATTKKRIDNVVRAKMAAMSNLQKSAPKQNSGIFNFSFMNKRAKIFAFAGSSVFLVVLGFFSFFMMVAAPLVIGSNIDAITKSISYNAPIKITFSSFMHHEKTEAAFKIEPEVKGRFNWEGNTLVFIPTENFKISDQYTVTIDTTAENVFGKKLESAYMVQFIVQGAPEVTFAAPQGITVGKEAKIVVMFNQPMVGLTDLDSQKADNIKLELNPATPGKVQWIDTSSFSFVPDAALLLGSTYTVAVQKGTTSLDGGQTEKDYQFTFKTIPPRIVTFEPANGYELAGTTTPLRVSFNQPIDLASLAQNVEITPSTKMTYVYDEKDSNNVWFKPEVGLKFTTEYKITLKKGVKGASGSATLEEDTVWAFKTVGIPTLQSTVPEKNSTNAEVYSVQLIFSNPMDRKSFNGKVNITPKVENFAVAESAWEDTETSVTVVGDLLYSTKYTVTVQPGVKDLYGQELKESVGFSFTTKPRDPYFKIARKDVYNLFNGYQNAVYPLKTVNLENVNAFLCQMTKEEFLARSFSYASENPNNCVFKKSWTIATKGKLNEVETRYIDFQEVLGRELTSGIYFLSLSSDKIVNDWERRDYVTFFVSKTALTMKVDKEKLLIWATDLGTGQPVAGEKISLASSTNAKILEGKTDANGLFQAPFNYNEQFFVFGERTGDMAVLSRWWNSGIASYDFGFNSDWQGQDASPFMVYMYTDRPIYRPEQKVYFKGIVRVDQDAKFALPDLKEVEIHITDAVGTELSTPKLKLSAMGTFQGEFLLDKNAPLGQYQMYMNLGENYFYQDFFVEEYRKPEFKVEIKTDKTAYAAGDTLNATVTGSYYFGGNLKNKKITWKLNRSDYYFPDYEGEWYSFLDGGGFWYCFDGCTNSDAFVTSGEGMLNDQGQMTITTPLDLTDKEVGQQYTLEATVEDTSSQTVSGRNSFVVHKGDYFVGIRSGEYSLTKGDKATFHTLVLDLSRTPVANTTVVLSAYERTWNQVQKKNIDGEFYNEFESKDTFLSKQEVRTDERGKASVEFTFDRGGEMVVKAVVTDSKQRAITSSTGVYVGDERYISWFSGNDSRMELIPDKQSYEVGETAKVMIKAPFEDAKALVTYERRNMMEKKIIDIKTTSDILEIPITDKFVPNIYISVVAMKGGGMDKSKLQGELSQIEKDLAALRGNPDLDPAIMATSEKELTGKKAGLEKLIAQAGDKVGKPSYRVGYANLSVNNKSKAITVGITPNKDRYEPREKVTLQLATTNYKNQAVPAEVSIAVVDESVLALKSKEEDILKIFYGKKGVGVDTASSMSIFTDTIVVKAGRAKGGGGGEAMASNNRANFKDTAFYKADVTTDASGKASVEFTLPDNLTTWRILAVAVNKETLVGSKAISILETKNLIMRPALPRFFRNGDEVTVLGIVQNGQAKEDTVTTTLTVKAGDITLTGNASQTVTVPKDGEGKSSWKIKVGKGSSATLVFTAKGGSAEDIIEITLPILPYATPEVVTTFGETDTSRTENLQLSDKVSKELGSVQVSVYTSLLTNITKGLEAMVRYPYGCAEQVMSTLLSAVSTKTLFEKMGQPVPDLVIEKGSLLENEKIALEKDPVKKIAMMVEVGLQKIYGYQRPDGGWGYWTESVISYPHLTAYVLYGLHEIKQAGYSVDEQAVQRGVQYLKDYISQHPLDEDTSETCYTCEVQYKKVLRERANERAFMLYALAAVGEGDIGLTNNLFDVRQDLGFYARGYLLSTLVMVKENEKAKTVLQELLANISEDVSARTAHLSEKESDTYSMNTDVRTTAIALRGILQLDPKNPLLSKMVRYLVRNKTYDRYINTQEITYTLFALGDYLTIHPEQQGSLNVRVSLNGATLMDEILDSDKNTQKSVTKDIAEFVGNKAELVLEERTPKTSFYYDIVTKYYLPLTEIAPRNRGFGIGREYFSFQDTEEKTPLKTAKVGEALKAKLTIVVPQDRHFVIVESHLPAGMEAVNFNLDTSQQDLQVGLNKEQNDLWGERYWESGLWRFNHTEIRDDRFVLFADYLPAGVYEYEYAVQMTSAGVFAQPPAVGYEMYFPEVFGRSRGEVFTVKE